MKPYSVDLREKVIQAYEKRTHSFRQLAAMFSVSLNFVWLLVSQHKKTGSVAPKPHRGGPSPKLTQAHIDCLVERVSQHNDATLLELADYLHQQTGVAVSRETIARALRKRRITRKKKTFHATERDEDPDIKAERAAFVQTLLELDIKNLCVLDECGLHLAMARLYARAPSGCRAEADRPADSGGNNTLIAGFTSHGIIAPMLIPGSLDGAAFEVYLQQALLPALPPGCTVLMDNLVVHKMKRIGLLLAENGVSVIFLPRYSPDLSPIELAWSKIKSNLCSAAARTFDELIAALAQAIDTVTQHDALAWFGHCGYRIEGVCEAL
ncbi:MAG: IS630 family transposase [Methylomonas sp.]|nr:IS630 family transposase [Methylomonas sp.]